MSRRPKNHVLLVQCGPSFRPERMHEMPDDNQIEAMRFLIRHVTRTVAVNAARAYNTRHLVCGPEFDGSWAMVVVSLRRQRSLRGKPAAMTIPPCERPRLANGCAGLGTLWWPAMRKSTVGNDNCKTPTRLE